MKRLRLAGYFLAIAMLALVKPQEPTDMLQCAEAGAAARARGEHPIGHRATDQLSTNAWFVVLMVGALLVSWSGLVALWVLL